MSAKPQTPQAETDPILRPFLDARDAEEAHRLLGELITNHAQPWAQKMAHFRLRSMLYSSDQDAPEADDISAEVAVQLFVRLERLRRDPRQATISNLRGYVAAIVDNACHHYVRRKFPERRRLHNRLRYVLNHHSALAIWEHQSGGWLCGFAQWKDDQQWSQCWTPRTSSQLEEIRGQVYASRSGLQGLSPSDLLEALFLVAKQPLEIDEVVGLAADVWGIRDLQRVAEEDEGGKIWDSLPDPRVDVASQVERRMYLAALWDEVRQLRPLQRAALLLNLRDRTGQDMLPMLVLVGVTTIPEVAESLDVSTEQFMALWDELPLDDLNIAARMGITRQQVINLRKSARERLARRMASR